MKRNVPAQLLKVTALNPYTYIRKGLTVTDYFSVFQKLMYEPHNFAFVLATITDCTTNT